MTEMYLLDKVERSGMYSRSTHFNLYYNERKKYEFVFSSLHTLCSNNKEIWCVITNTARAIKQQAVYMQIPKDNSAYVQNKMGISRRRMFKLLDILVENGYLVFYKGGFINIKKEEYAPSLYEITDKMKLLWVGIDIDEDLVYDGDLVEIKDRKSKEQLNNKIRGTAEIRRVVGKYNLMLSTVVLSCNGVTLPVQQYKRVFSDNLSLGGRFYNVSGGVQTMKQEDRKKLRINGEKVVELDFKSLHPSILYEQVYKDDPEFVDAWIARAWDGVYNPYSTKHSEELFDVDNDEIGEHIMKYGLNTYNPMRNLFKTAVMISLNALRGKTRPMLPASSAITIEWYEDKKKSEADRKFVGLYPIGDKFPALDLCELVQAANKPIEDFFFSDAGVKLQRVDSEILGIVIQRLLDEGEVLYPEHDSIIVRESIEHKATQLMRDAYFSVLGSDNFCFIEKK